MGHTGWRTCPRRPGELVALGSLCWPGAAPRPAPEGSLVHTLLTRAPAAVPAFLAMAAEATARRWTGAPGSRRTTAPSTVLAAPEPSIPSVSLNPYP
jgi:hypothetical protein